MERVRHNSPTRLTLRATLPSSLPAAPGSYHRVEILGALFSVFTIWLVTGVIVNEAIDRINHPADVLASARPLPSPTCAPAPSSAPRPRPHPGRCISAPPSPRRTQGRDMFIIAVLGIFVNIGLVFVLQDAGSHGHSHGGLSGGARTAWARARPPPPRALEPRQACAREPHAPLACVGTERPLQPCLDRKSVV